MIVYEGCPAGTYGNFECICHFTFLSKTHLPLIMGYILLMLTCLWNLWEFIKMVGARDLGTITALNNLSPS